MAGPSALSSIIIISLSYGAFLFLGIAFALRLKHQTETQWLCANRTQTAVPLALNFIASANNGFEYSLALGSGILFSYPQLATITGVQGVVTYAITSSAPLILFAYIGPVIRKKCPDGFVLTEWTRQRYGIMCSLYLSFLTLLTTFLYMVAELSALRQIITTLTGIDGLRFVIVQCAITTVYTVLGGFQISFLTDNIQGMMVIGLITIAAISIGLETKIDQNLVDSSGLTKPSLLGWQLLYILPVAIMTNNFFLSNLWIRVFASKTDKDLIISAYLATIIIFIILTLVGSTGLIACWTGAFDPTNHNQDDSIAFFYLLEKLPAWVIGIVLVMVVTLSTAAFDSLQTAMISTASNDFFRNKLNIWWIRLIVMLVMIPIITISLKAPSILQIYLISDLIATSTIPLLILGLNDKIRFLEGVDIVVGGVGGLLSVFVFGTIYYGNMRRGIRLILLDEGLYASDWSVFGAFATAPSCGLLIGVGTCCARHGYRTGIYKLKSLFNQSMEPIPSTMNTPEESESVSCHN